MAEILEETSSSEYAIDHRLSRLRWKPRRAAIWLCDRYQEGSGLAPLEALEQDEISTLLGHPVDFIAQHALPTSFLATALCDLAAFVDGGLYSDVVNDVKASRIAMRYWQAQDSDGLFRIDGNDIVVYPNIEYCDRITKFDAYEFAEHIVHEPRTFRITQITGPSILLSVMQGDRIILKGLQFLSHSVCFTALTKTLHERRRAQVRAPRTD